MAITATFDHVDGLIGLMTCLNGQVEKVSDDPPLEGYDPDFRLWFYWDAEKLFAAEEYVFIGLEVNDVGMLREEDFQAIDQLDLPRVDVREFQFHDACISDVLRWAKQTYSSRYATALT